MNAWKIAALLAVGMMLGCMASGPPLTAQNRASSGAGAAGGRGAYPLLLDRSDLRIGTTVHYRRMPDAGEINDLRLVHSLAHVVLSLDAWPTDVTVISSLSQVPPEADVIVVLPGYPPSRAANELWNYVEGRVRLVMLVDGPPPSGSVIDDLNSTRRLERVIAEMDDPSRSGFERLQRPLSFRKIMP
jgi:hypothetical protein